MLQTVKRKMQTQPNDYLRVNIDHPSLDSPVLLEFTQAKNLKDDKILGKIAAVQQSKKEFIISDGRTELDIFHIKYPQGTGGNLKKTPSSQQGNFQEIKTSHRADPQPLGFFVPAPSPCCCPASCP
jgi:hypothetical protein